MDLKIYHNGKYVQLKNNENTTEKNLVVLTKEYIIINASLEKEKYIYN